MRAACLLAKTRLRCRTPSSTAPSRSPAGKSSGSGSTPPCPARPTRGHSRTAGRRSPRTCLPQQGQPASQVKRRSAPRRGAVTTRGAEERVKEGRGHCHGRAARTGVLQELAQRDGLELNLVAPVVVPCGVGGSTGCLDFIFGLHSARSKNSSVMPELLVNRGRV